MMDVNGGGLEWRAQANNNMPPGLGFKFLFYASKESFWEPVGLGVLDYLVCLGVGLGLLGFTLMTTWSCLGVGSSHV